jgi:hypothetical protein
MEEKMRGSLRAILESFYLLLKKNSLSFNRTGTPDGRFLAAGNRRLIKASIKNTWLSIVILSMVSCGGGGVVKPQNKTLVKTSSPSEPAWVMMGKKGSGEIFYFVGRVDNVTGFKGARDAAIGDAVKQILQYIGFQATHEFKVSKQILAGGAMNADTYRTEIIDSIEGKGSAKVSVDVEEVYYEQYSDDSYNVSVLLKIPKSWIDAEKARLAKQTKEQHDTAVKYLAESDTQIKSGNISAALDSAVSAIYISILSADNKDVYDSAKSKVYDILSSLAFALKNAPAFAYKEGGSDPIDVIVSSSKSGKPVAGLLTASAEDNGKAEMLAPQGYSSGSDGKVTYEARADASMDSLNVSVSFSLSKLDDLKKADEEYYNKLVKLQKSISLKVPLKLAAKILAVPTAVVVIDIVFAKNEKKPVTKPVLVPQMQDVFAGFFAKQGFNIISVEIPESVFNSGAEEKMFKESIITYLKEKYPNVKRLLFAVEVVNLLGKTKDIIGPGKGFENEVSVDVTLNFSIIDLDTNKLEKSATLKGGAYAATPQQAVQIARKNIIDKLKKQFEGK